MSFPIGCYPKSQKPLSVPFVGVLDVYEPDLTLAIDLARRLLSSYTGGAFIARADRTGQPTMTIPFLADGTRDNATLLSFAQGGDVYVVTPLNQCSSGIVMTQASAGAQPRIVTAGAIEANGAKISNDSRKWRASLADILDLVGSQQGHIYSDLRLDSLGGGTAQEILSGPGGLIAYLNYFNSATMYFDWQSYQRVSCAVPSGMMDTPSSVSLEHDATGSRIRVNGSVEVSGAVAGTIASAAYNLDVPDSGGGFYGSGGFYGNISSYIVWKTCDATLAAGRVAALA